MFDFSDALSSGLLRHTRNIFFLAFNLISTVFSLFSFAAIIPVLQILFGLTKSDTVYIPELEWGIDDRFRSCEKNLGYYIQQLIVNAGPGNGSVLSWLIPDHYDTFQNRNLLPGFIFRDSYIVPACCAICATRCTKNNHTAIGFFSPTSARATLCRVWRAMWWRWKHPSSARWIWCLKSGDDPHLCGRTIFANELGINTFVMVLLPISAWLIGVIGRSLKKRSTIGSGTNRRTAFCRLKKPLGGFTQVL